MTLRPTTAFAISILLVITGSPLFAGDRYWSPVPGLNDLNDVAVCGTTVYAATADGLLVSQGDPEQWNTLRPGETYLVACSGPKVIWEEADGLSSVVYVSHDGLATVTASQGLEDSISRGLRDLAIAGDTALVATRWGVDRSTDGGLNFPAAYPVLWESSAGYEITAVWTDGTNCAAAGSGGFAGQGIWYSPSGDSGTWTMVLDIGGQEWLSGDASGTIISGDLYGSVNDSGYISTDSGSSWTQLPFTWGSTPGHYQRPFLSGTRILSRHVYEEFDPGSGQFITHTNGPYFYDTAQSIGNDMDDSLAWEGEILNQAIVEGPDPFLLIASRGGEVWWYRCPGGWPANGFDFTPPLYPNVNTSPRLGTTPPTAGFGVAPYAVGADWMYLEEIHYMLQGTFAANTYYWSLTWVPGPNSGGWVPFATSQPWTMHPGTGTHSIYAWFADAAGNMTDPAVQSATTTFPQSLVLASGEPWGTFMYAVAGESFAIGGTGPSGDIDVHHWEPGSTWSDDWAATYDNDTLTFTADTTGYHLIMILNYPGAGSFNGTIVAQPAVKNSSTTVPNDKPSAGMGGNAAPGDPPPYHESGGVSLIFADGFESGSTDRWGS